MRKIIILTGLLFAASCSSTKEDAATTENPIVAEFLNDVSSIESYSGNPIDTFKVVATSAAAEEVKLTKDNASEVFSKMKDFSKVVIVTGNHTIVLLDGSKECKDSGSWGTCMPFGKGYIKKGELNAEEDYINNIIGRPDDQERIVYFFN